MPLFLAALQGEQQLGQRPQALHSGDRCSDGLSDAEVSPVRKQLVELRNPGLVRCPVECGASRDRTIHVVDIKIGYDPIPQRTSVVSPSHQDID